MSIRDKNNLFAACYINLDKYDYTVVREGYENCIRHMAGQFGFPFRICRNLPELKRRMEREAYTHIFIGWEEYDEDRGFFDRLCTEKTVVLLLDYDRHRQCLAFSKKLNHFYLETPPYGTTTAAGTASSGSMRMTASAAFSVLYVTVRRSGRICCSL